MYICDEKEMLRVPEDSSAMRKQEVTGLSASTKVTKETNSSSSSPRQIRWKSLNLLDAYTSVPPAEIFLE